MKVITPVAQMGPELTAQNDDAMFAVMMGIQPGELSPVPSEEAMHIGAAALLNGVEAQAVNTVPAPDQTTDLFGNPISGEQSYSAEDAAKDTHDIRLLVGRVLVETAAKIGNDEVAEKLTGDAERSMRAWKMQQQYAELMRQNHMMQFYHAEEARRAEEAESDDGSATTSDAKARNRLSKWTNNRPKNNRTGNSGPNVRRKDSSHPAGLRSGNRQAAFYRA